MPARPIRGTGCLLGGLLAFGLAIYGGLSLAGVEVPWWFLAIDGAAWVALAVMLLLARPLEPPE
jgi:hypothetical protein